MSVLTLYMFCTPNDGAAAVVLCSQKAAKKYSTKPVILASCAHRLNPYPEMNVGNYFGYKTNNKPSTTLAAIEAYEKAKIKVEGAYRDSLKIM